jgi:hypothetical protein
MVAKQRRLHLAASQRATPRRAAFWSCTPHTATVKARHRMAVAAATHLCDPF